MAIRQRAIQAEDKHERHRAILDAAERLLLREPDRVASVSEVADEAGLAKGTVYLYFPSKEELLLALHERNIDAFFRPLIERLRSRQPLTLDDLFSLAREHIVAPPLVLPLASRCFGLMAQAIPPQAAAAFRQRMIDRMMRAGAGLERHFPQLAPGAGMTLLRHSYALIIGLWQMYGAKGDALHRPATGSPVDPPGEASTYPDDLRLALSALWRGALGGPNANDGMSR
jgi:AcrR family transcriptional regulator